MVAQQRAPILHGLGHMRSLDVRAAGQIGNGARDLQHAVQAAPRPAHARGRRLHKASGRGRELQVLVHCRPLQRLVGHALAFERQRMGAHHAFADLRRGLAGGGLQQLRGRQGRHFDMQVDAVKQRPAELALVARHLVGRAAAAPQRRAPETAGAGVHGRDQLKARGKLGALRGARNRDAAGLHGLAQRFERGAAELGN